MHILWKNNFPQYMVYRACRPHSIYGGMTMIRALRPGASPEETGHANGLNFFLFLTGAALGTALVLSGAVELGMDAHRLSQGRSLGAVLLANGRLLALLWLLAHMPVGAMLVPPLMGLEGVLYGGAFAFVTVHLGMLGAGLLAAGWLFRLLLVLPYGFLLGAWSVGRSLRGVSAGSGGVLLVTAAVVLTASLLECTVATRLAAFYYLKFGV